MFPIDVFLSASWFSRAIWKATRTDPCVPWTTRILLFHWQPRWLMCGFQPSAVAAWNGCFLVIWGCCVLRVRPTCSVGVYFQLAFPSLQIPPTVLWLPATAAIAPTSMCLSLTNYAAAHPSHMYACMHANTHTYRATDKHRTVSPWQPAAHAVSTGWWNLAG